MSQTEYHHANDQAGGFAEETLDPGDWQATVIGLVVARNFKAGFDVRRQGLAAAQRPLVLYASCEAHDSVQKAIELLGLGSEALRLIPVRDDYKMDVQALQAVIAADRAAGHLPFCVVGTAGTTNTGSVDNLSVLADIVSISRPSPRTTTAMPSTSAPGQ